MSAGPGRPAPRQSGSERGASTAGTTARPHCLADDDRDALPALEAAAAGEGGLRHVGPGRQHRLDRRHAHHHRVADDVVDLVALEHGLRQRDPDAPLGRRDDGLPHLDHDAGPVHRGHPGLDLAPPAVEDPDGRARLHAQDAAKVPGLVFGQRDRAVAGVERRHVQARHHAAIIDKASYTPPQVRMFFRGQTIGKYKILSALGSGGFGTVYLAEDTWIDKKVALKVPHRQSVELRRTAQGTAAARQPESSEHRRRADGREAGQRLLHRDGVRGGRDAREHHRPRGALEMPRALDFTCQICNAVDHAHRQGVHPPRPAPGQHHGRRQRPREGRRLRHVALPGTGGRTAPRSSAARPYMAPEQFHGKATFASDIYSLGVTMYQMMTGTLPYQTPAPGRPGAADARATWCRRRACGTAASRSASTTSF